MMRKKLFLLIMLYVMVIFSVGCNEVIIGTNLEKGDKYYAKGDYQNAYNCYMKAAEEYQARLGKVYSDKAQAKADAAKLVEAYHKSGLTCEKLANDAGARAMFEKAAKDTYAIKESYYEKIQVNVPAGYADRWVPSYYKDVYVDGHYEDVYVDGGTKQVYVDATTKQVYVDDYKEVYVDGYYRQDGTYVNGYYKKVKNGGHYETQTVPGYYKTVAVDGHYEKKWVDGYYKKQIVDGHYEKVWEPEHIDIKDVYKERDASVTTDSAYVSLSKAKLPANAAQQAPAEPTNPTAKAAYDKMVKAYEAYMKAGSPASGAELDAYKAAQDEFNKANKQ